MIGCVESRIPERPYCSRVCCAEALKNALRIKALSPEASVYMLYRDIRSYGLLEELYARAREAGVTFIQYQEEDPPRLLPGEGSLHVGVTDLMLEEELLIPADIVVLNVPTVPNPDNGRLARMLKVPLDRDGFFMEAHVKLAPVDFATDGIFLCGLAHGPKNLEESIVQARAAGARACTVLAKEFIQAEGTVARVNPGLCSGCGTCEAICPYKAVIVEAGEMGQAVQGGRRPEGEPRLGNRRLATVNAALCKGCGLCAASCLCGAIDLSGFDDKGILAELVAL